MVQLCWIGRLWLHGLPGTIGFPVLVAAELAVPVWAEFAGRATPWHPGHIGERYGLFTIIVLGEAVSAIATAVQSALSDHGASLSLLTVAVAGLLLGQSSRAECQVLQQSRVSGLAITHRAGRRVR